MFASRQYQIILEESFQTMKSSAFSYDLSLLIAFVC